MTKNANWSFLRLVETRSTAAGIGRAACRSSAWLHRGMYGCKRTRKRAKDHLNHRSSRFTQTLTEDERKKLNGFLLECHRTQKRKSRYPTVYAGSADIFRAKRRQRKFALLQQKAPTVETERSAKLRKGEDPKKLSDDKKQAAVARAASPAAASPAKCPSPESLPDVNLEASANQQSLEKENAATDGARQDDEQHQQVETPKRLESMTKDEKAKEDEERSTPKAPSLPPQEATDTRKAADELSGNQQSVAASGHSQPRRVEANHEAPIKVQNASFCEAEPHEVNGAEKEAQRRQQSARRRKIRKKHANLKHFGVEGEKQEESEKHKRASMRRTQAFEDRRKAMWRMRPRAKTLFLRMISEKWKCCSSKGICFNATITLSLTSLELFSQSKKGRGAEETRFF
ncbi:hypothetical protein Esti_006471 [Eimeria stiedai]